MTFVPNCMSKLSDVVHSTGQSMTPLFKTHESTG